MNKPKKLTSEVKNINSLLNKFILFSTKNTWLPSVLLYIYKVDKRERVIYYYFYEGHNFKQQERSLEKFMSYIDYYYEATYSI